MIKDYDPDLIYNADETGLYYRALPTRTLASKSEGEVSGFKVNKERVTIMVCSNMSGSHKIPLSVIGKSKVPHCLRSVNMSNIPSTYMDQKNAWMDRVTFDKWMEIFKMETKKVHQDKEVLLLLDNAPGHYGKVLIMSQYLGGKNFTWSI